MIFWLCLLNFHWWEKNPIKKKKINFFMIIYDKSLTFLQTGLVKKNIWKHSNNLNDNRLKSYFLTFWHFFFCIFGDSFHSSSSSSVEGIFFSIKKRFSFSVKTYLSTEGFVAHTWCYMSRKINFWHLFFVLLLPLWTKRWGLEWFMFNCFVFFFIATMKSSWIL